MSIKRKALSFVVLLLLVPASSQALTFGKNRVRVDKHKWYIAETEHFEIYHYEEAKGLMTDVSILAEEAYDHVTGVFNYYPLAKSPMFLYLTSNHFNQNNIANAEGAGGFAEPLKNRFVFPLTGSQRRLRHVLFHEFAHDVCFYVWYDANISGYLSFLKPIFKTANLVRSVFYPLWIIEGVAEYASGHYDDLSYADMVLRDAVISGIIIPLTDLQNFGSLRGYQTYLAYKESESAIRYIAREYGKEKVAEIIAIYRQSIDVNSVLKRTIENNLAGFDREWQRHLEEKYAGLVEQKHEAEYYGDRITGDNEFNTSPVFSPDSSKMAFISNRKGYNDIYIMNEDGSGQRSLLNSRIGFRIEYAFGSGHALSWSPDGKKIAFAGSKNYKDYICIVNARGWGLKKIPIPLDSVSSPCYSPDGQSIVFVGMKNGISDLWLLNIENNTMKQLTDNEYDDDYPVFSPDGKRIVYVSEHGLQKDMYIYDMKTGNVKQLTDTSHYEIHPEWSGDGKEIYYISDPEGTYNLYRMAVDGSRKERLSDIITGLFNPAVSARGDKIAFVSYCSGEKNIYIKELSGLKAIIAEPVEKVNEQVYGNDEVIREVKKPSDISPIKDIRKYKFNLSTDLMFPFGIPGIDGSSNWLCAMGVWYLSDMLGNHNLSTSIGAINNAYPGDRDWLDFYVSYLYRGMKPDIGFTHTSSKYEDANRNFYNDYKNTFRLTYPFGRFNGVSIAAGIQEKKKWDINDNSVMSYVDHVAAVSFIRDTTQGKMLDIMSGHRANVTIEKAFNVLGGLHDYSMLQLDVQKYITVRNFRLHDFHVLALRFRGGVIQGQDRSFSELQFNRPGSYLMARGLFLNYSEGNMFSLFNAELRLMMIPEIDYHMWYIWPDIYVKNLQMVFFLDSGRTWQNGEVIDLNGFNVSVGVGARINMFILQQYPIVLRLDYTAQLNNFSSNRITLSLGPTF